MVLEGVSEALGFGPWASGQIVASLGLLGLLPSLFFGGLDLPLRGLEGSAFRVWGAYPGTNNGGFGVFHAL